MTKIKKEIENSINFLKSKKIDIDVSEMQLNNINSFVSGLIHQNLNDNILRYIISEFLGGKFVNLSSLENEKIEKTNYGFIYEDAYIVDYKNHYLSNIFKKISMKYKKVLFNRVIFADSNQMLELEKRYKINSRERNSRRVSKIKSDLIELIDQMIIKNINQIFLDTEKLTIEYYYDGFFNSEKSNIFENIKSEVIFNCIKELIDENDFYKINKTQKITTALTSENSIILKRYDFYNNEDKLSSTQYGEDYLKQIESNSGIFLLSQDADYNYYYDLIEYFENTENKKVLSFSSNNKKNSATKRGSYEEDFPVSSAFNFDYLMVDDMSKINDNILKLINYFTSVGKKVVLVLTSKDGVNSLANIIYNYEQININVLSSAIGSIYHVSKIPKLCNDCKKSILLKDFNGIREKYPDILKRHSKNEEIFLRNEEGCKNCVSGYQGFIPVEQLVKKTAILSEGITRDFNVSKMKDELSSESNYSSITEKMEPLIFKDKIVSLADLENKV